MREHKYGKHKMKYHYPICGRKTHDKIREDTEKFKVSLPDSTKLIEGKILNGKYSNKELSEWADGLK